MNIREQYEEIERSFLSPKAVLSSKSKGRLRKEADCPIRTCFQRDRDRIIHSKSFRRLKHKTQVFIDPEEDHYRTRLTHTLEVAQISRTIARALRLNEDLTEAIALGHDLGHTPFGHAGEKVLDKIYRKYTGNGFRHSEQSLRVVDVLEKRGMGLNLTMEVRDGILRHSKGRADLSISAKDPYTLEGCIVKISDRIAYINHDIDDAIRANIITENDLPKSAVCIVGNTHSQRIGAMVTNVIEHSKHLNSISMSDTFRKATDELKDFLFVTVYDRNVRGIAELEYTGEILRDLFRFYMENPKEIPDMIDCERNVNLENTENRARVVCDLISGMTDRYAQKDHKRRFANAIKTA